MTDREQPKQTDDSRAFRTALRREKLAARAKLSATEHAQLSACIATHLRTRLLSQAPAHIGFCLPIRNEFDACGVIGELLAQGWRASVPVVEQTAAAMSFRHWSPSAVIAIDRFGIPVPESSTSEIPDILLLPLVAFDAHGFRLGYGGGYFDRTLAVCVPRPLCIGVGFELARVPSIRPQAHDQACDWLLTEAGWFASPSATTVNA